jgi:protoporphyrinogen/coproporphyrinogen III oxidase
LTRTLAEKVGPAIQLNTEVRAISRSATGWRLQMGWAQEALEAEKLVLAVPSYAAARLLRPIDEKLASELDGIEYAPISVVHLGYAQAEPAVPSGFGFLVPAEERLHILGSIFISSIFPWRSEGGRTLLTCMVAGARQPELFDLPDGDLVRVVRQDLDKVLGLKAAPSFQQIVRWKRGIPQYNVGHLARLRRIDEAVSRLPGLALTGNAYRGVGLNDCVRNSTELAKHLAGGAAQR